MLQLPAAQARGGQAALACVCSQLCPWMAAFLLVQQGKIAQGKKKNKKNKAGADEAFGYCQVKVLEGRATWHACVMTSSAQPIAAGRGGLLIAAALLHLQGKEQ